MTIRLADYKAKIQSQHGEDGVIAAIFREIGTATRTCVEFGGYDLKRFSNVFPLWTTGWKTLLIEGNESRFRQLVADYASYPGSDGMQVSIVNKYVEETGPNSLDAILAELQFPVEIDLVSIDIDGTDFHVWRGCKRFQPRVVIVEYNPMIPHHIEMVGAATGNEIGCSVLSLAKLGKEKGYSLVSCVGWNAVFVRQEYAGRFADADNLDALFDPNYIRYAMQSYGGEVFFSAPLHLDYEPFSQDSKSIESSSITIGRLGDTLSFMTRRTAWQYLRKLKHLLLGPPRRRR